MIDNWTKWLKLSKSEKKYELRMINGERNLIIIFPELFHLSFYPENCIESFPFSL